MVTKYRYGDIEESSMYWCACLRKTRQALCKNIPLELIPKENWEIVFDVMEPLIEKSLYDMAQTQMKERWLLLEEQWKKNPDKVKASNGPFLGKIYCAKCGRKLRRANTGSVEKANLIYKCPNTQNEYHGCSLSYLREDAILKAVKEAFCTRYVWQKKVLRSTARSFIRN